ncbi:transcriptional regulator, TetR family [Nocardia amikacinitolerans]|uniref:TetR/AcrR family transcriptional regulator n=1 Tax=Nocardia amikacinitolerans TaxID=756689 RepID=UPI0009FB9C10|nr:TetR/AcrR family transcriptional regulator [Nocardia amikacinitolerans]MCP2321251.1 transcriptional regulator, TetR family [Nocardia amikacinitolerans]
MIESGESARCGRRAPEKKVVRRRRADAVRNRRKLVEAAESVLAERGLDMTLDEVAAAAGVGVGTVYRHFANKQELIDDLLTRTLEELAAAAEVATREVDAWSGLARWLEYACGRVAGNRGLSAALSELLDRATASARYEETIEPALIQLLERAKADGAVRPDVEVADVCAAVTMVHGIAILTEPVLPENWRRYLALLLAGMRASTVPQSPLPSTPLTPDQMRRARAAAADRRK